MPEHTIEDAITAAGGLAVVASELNERQQTVWNWKARGNVPADRCADFERITGLAKWHQRPSDWHRIWPELVNAEGAPRVGG